METINQAGIPIVSYPGLHGGIGIMENYKMEKRLFSTADVTTLLKGMHWYLDGYSLERQDFRLFKLARMKRIILSDSGFVPRDYHPETKVHPDFQDENIVTITARVKGDAVERLEELFGADIFISENRTWHTAQISLTDDARGYRFLLGFGADCVCIASENMRKNIADYLRKKGHVLINLVFVGIVVLLKVT